MIKFIKLSEYSHGPIYINTNCIDMLVPTENGTYVGTVGNLAKHVSESVDEILVMINSVSD